MFSFSRRNHQTEVRDLLRRITNRSTPNLAPFEGDSRSDNRYNRTFPVLIVPIRDGAAAVDEATTALTKDFSDRGIALVLKRPFHVETVVLGLAVPCDQEIESAPQSLFALGQVRQQAALGGGYWQVGVELTGLTDPVSMPVLEQLEPVVRYLLPSNETEAAEAASPV